LREARLGHLFDLRSAYNVHEGEGGGEGGGDGDGDGDSNGNSDSSSGGNGELLPFTNVTSDFVGTLDYIFYEKSAFEQLERLDVPTNFRRLNTNMVTNGHLLPSDIWPSDHLVIGATFRLSRHHQRRRSTAAVSKSRKDGTNVATADVVEEKDNERDGSALLPKLRAGEQPIASAIVPTDLPDQPIASAFVSTDLLDRSIVSAIVPTDLPDQPIASAYVPTDLPNQTIASAYVPTDLPDPPITDPHTMMPNCACGCVPNIRSLFQMAELRKQARLKKAQQASSS